MIDFKIPPVAFTTPDAFPYRGQGAMAFMAGYGLTDVPPHLNQAQAAAWTIGWLDQLADSVRPIRMGNQRP